VHRLNTSDETAGANQINEWVSHGTSGKITDVISSLPPDTKLIVANVIYMNAIWDEPFDVKSTSNEPFHVSATETITVPSMITTQTVDYFPDRELGCQIMALPYKVIWGTIWDTGALALNRVSMWSDSDD
jgi:serine protease inhibitor